MEQDGGDSVVSMKYSFSEVWLDKTSKRRNVYQCSECNYTSLNHDHMKKHMTMHSGEKTNKCSQCNFASSWPQALRAHSKIHSGEKAKKCNQCEYASSQACNLRKHLKIHSGEKYKKCNQCNCIFSGRPFEETFENSQWRKVKQTQPM